MPKFKPQSVYIEIVKDGLWKPKGTKLYLNILQAEAWVNGELCKVIDPRAEVTFNQYSWGRTCTIKLNLEAQT